MSNNPAEIASEKALKEMFDAISNGRSFRFEAGAGAGKTYSLIKALHFLIKQRSKLFLKEHQRIACITYTNVAKDEILERIDNNPIVLTETIHGFIWNVIQRFQNQLRLLMPTLTERWTERINEIGGITNQSIEYSLGYPKATETTITLHHDDVIRLMSELLKLEKFKDFLKSEFPIILVDEYQDTNKGFADSIVNEVLAKDVGILFGFFGDAWQKIYGSGSCGKIESDKLVEINKEANFRSEKNIVEVLNRIRPDLKQNEKDPESQGVIQVYHTNSFSGIRRTEAHWKDDLPEETASNYLERVIAVLKQKEWDFSEDKTKVLILTNNSIADKQGFRNLANQFRDTDQYLKMNDHYIDFFVNVIEPVCSSFESKKYGKMFALLPQSSVQLTKHSDKKAWNDNMNELLRLRTEGSVSDIIELLKTTKRPRLSAKIEEKEKEFESIKVKTERTSEDESWLDEKIRFRSVAYQEVIELSKFVDHKTPFSTNHGVKGAEFENVLVVCGRGWNQYNWNAFLEWEQNAPPANKIDSYERNRNLFYVACSRPKRRLTVLFTQHLSEPALTTVNRWFGNENVQDISTILEN